MILHALLGVLLCVGAGGVIYGITRYFHSEYKLTLKEFAIGVPIVILAVFLTAWVGYNVAYNNKVTYHEFWGGYEVKAYPVVYQCHESSTDGGSTGGCDHTYNADEYSTQETYTVTVDDGKGKSHTETRCCKTVWHDRQVPYTDTETTWMVHTTLGDYNVGNHWLPANPNAHRIRPEHDSMHGLNTSLSSGTPQLWQAAYDRIARADPGPVTAQRDYPNYILASQSTLLHRYSQSIDRYVAAKLLPDINHDVNNEYYLNRVFFAGEATSGLDQGSWQFAINRFNAALGSDLQGNMYVVIVDANKVSDADDYEQALAAYWQRPELDKFQISKNGIIVVLGTKDGKTVEWARASTGMPEGNEVMLRQIQHDLEKVALTPDAVLGTPKAAITVSTDDKAHTEIVHTSPTEGALESIVWGTNKFTRVHMGSYLYLKGEIQPSTGQWFVIYLIMFFVTALIWGGIMYLGISTGYMGGEALQQKYRTRRYDDLR